MRLKAETKQLITFLKAIRTEQYKNSPVADICYYLKLSPTMMGNSLSKLYKSGIISRDRNGAGSRYLYPETLNLGDIIVIMQGFQLGDKDIQDSVISVLNQTKL